MSILQRWKVGATALQLANAAGQLVRSADLAAAWAALGKILELEALDIPGNQKLYKLIQWFGEQWPQYKDAIFAIKDFATAAVALFKAVQLFRGK